MVSAGGEIDSTKTYSDSGLLQQTEEAPTLITSFTAIQKVPGTFSSHTVV